MARKLLSTFPMSLKIIYKYLNTLGFCDLNTEFSVIFPSFFLWNQRVPTSRFLGSILASDKISCQLFFVSPLWLLTSDHFTTLRPWISSLIFLEHFMYCSCNYISSYEGCKVNINIYWAGSNDLLAFCWSSIGEISVNLIISCLSILQ